MGSPLSLVEVMNVMAVATFHVHLWSPSPMQTATKEGRGDPVNRERIFIVLERKNYPDLELLGKWEILILMRTFLL